MTYAPSVATSVSPQSLRNFRLRQGSTIMPHRFLIVLAALLLPSLLPGCYTIAQSPPDEKSYLQSSSISGVVLVTGEKIDFRDNGAIVEPGSGLIIGRSSDGVFRQISKDDVSYLLIRKRDTLGSIVVGAVVVGAVVSVFVWIYVHSFQEGLCCD